MLKAGFVLILMFFLTGCSDTTKEIDRGMELRTRLLSENCSFDTEITADYGESLEIFSLSCQSDAQGEVIFTVTEPETIQGITGKISERGGELTFDDTVLFFPLLAEETLSPISAPWILIKTLRSGYLTSACSEEELLRLTIDDSYDQGALKLNIWLDGENRPVIAHIFQEGKRILSLKITNFEIQ